MFGRRPPRSTPTDLNWAGRGSLTALIGAEEGPLTAVTGAEEGPPRGSPGLLRSRLTPLYLSG
jgi:hypothetical protein